MNALLLVNPAAGQGSFVRNGRPTWRLSRVIERLGQRFDIEWQLTAGPGLATEQARKAAASGVDAVFALGGDGTLREAAAGLLGTSVPLGLLAGGTANVLVPSLGLPSNALEAAELFAPNDGSSKASVRPLDVGLCGDHPFLMMMSRGLDGRALLSVSKRLKRRIGRPAIGLSAAAQFLRRPEPFFAASWEASEQESEAGSTSATAPAPVAATRFRSTFLAACNVPHYGGKFVLAPGASPFDRQLDIVSLNAYGRWPTARFAAATLAGRAAKAPGVVTAKTRSLTLLSDEDLSSEGQAEGREGRESGEALIQIDGDPVIVKLPITVTLSQQRLLLIWPRR